MSKGHTIIARLCGAQVTPAVNGNEVETWVLFNEKQLEEFHERSVRPAVERLLEAERLLKAVLAGEEAQHGEAIEAWLENAP